MFLEAAGRIHLSGCASHSHRAGGGTHTSRSFDCATATPYHGGCVVRRVAAVGRHPERQQRVHDVLQIFLAVVGEAQGFLGPNVGVGLNLKP